MAPGIRIAIEVALGVVSLGVVLGILSFVSVLVRVVFDRGPLVTPQKFKEERTKAEAGKHMFELDSAWAWYFYAQFFVDDRYIRDRREAVNDRLWSRFGEPLFRSIPKPNSVPIELLWVCFPYPLITLPLLVCIWISSWACNLIFITVAYVVLAIAWVGYVISVGLLRAIEAVWSRARKTSASCPACFHVSRRPAYKCAGCGALHRDIRPGRLGAFERRCECGQVMHTMVLRAAWTEQAVCQRCGEPLREGAAAVRDVRLPIFGDVAAGKTRLLYATLDSMSALGSKHALAVSYPDAESRQRAEAALETIRSGRDTTKTDVVLPKALSFRLGTGNGSTLIHMFDAAGELYRSSDRYDEVSFLDSAHGLVYVVDPFALEQVRIQVTGHAAAAQRVADGQGKDPEFAYNHVVTQLRDGGVKAKSQRLAIVVSKADALFACGVECPTDSEGIGAWLRESGLHNVVMAAPNEFAEVKYFAVASIPSEHATIATDPGAPVRWLLRKHGVKLPAEVEEPTVSEVTT
jgi:hypothetical protein